MTPHSDAPVAQFLIPKSNCHVGGGVPAFRLTAHPIPPMTPGAVFPPNLSES